MARKQSPRDPYPEPVEHCAICRWSVNSNDRRRKDDDLSLIAGMATGQRLALKGVGVSTRRGFADPDIVTDARVRDPGSVARAQLQARLQVSSEDAGEIEYQLLEPDRDDQDALVPNRGLLALPEPSWATSSSISKERATTPKTGRNSACSTCSASSTPPTSMPMARRVYPDLGLRPGGRKERVRGAHRLHHRTAEAKPPSARLPLQPLRADVDRPPDSSARDPRGGRRPADGPVRHP